MTWREVGNVILGLGPRLQAWLAQELDYRECSREEAARELLRGAIDAGEVASGVNPRRPSVFALPRRKASDVIDLSPHLPELRRRWRQP